MSRKAKMSETSGLSRRTVLGAIGTTSLPAFAGCNFITSDNQDNDLGERVPTYEIAYFSGLGGYTSALEQMQPAFGNLEELGVSIDYQPVDVGTAVEQQNSDSREWDALSGLFTPSPARLDPSFLRRFSVDFAGANGNPNNFQYASCEYSTPAVEQNIAASPEQRTELVDEAQKIFSEDVVGISTVNVVIFSAINKNRVKIDGIGEAGMQTRNANSYIKSEATEDDYLHIPVNPGVTESRRFPLATARGTLNIWNRLVHSPLVEYNENYELENVLAESYEFTDDGHVLTVVLKDATFHNGDPVTAEDVKFTFEHINDEPEYPIGPNLSLDTIRVVDQNTVEFNFDEPQVSAISRVIPIWGIFHKDTWENGGAEEDKTGWDFDPIIGSGPYQVENIVEGQSMTFDPHDGHPVYSPQTGVKCRAFRESATAVEAFASEELDTTGAIGISAFERLEDEDYVEPGIGQGFVSYSLQPQMSFGPSKFKEFRRALGVAIDRQSINQLALGGHGQEILSPTPFFSKSHPWFNGEVTEQLVDDPSGDIDQARSILEQSGWEWDSNGNLHYPTNADLTPLWAEGETPSAEDYPCLNDL